MGAGACHHCRAAQVEARRRSAGLGFRPSLLGFSALARVQRKDRRAAVLFGGGLVLAVLGVAAVGRFAPEGPGAGAALSPGAGEGGSSALVLGPRDPNEPPASAEFEPRGRRSGFERSFYVLGVVKNTSPFPIDRPEVRVTLLDAAGHVVALRQGYGERDRLEPSESCPAKVLVSEPPEHVSLAYAVVARRALFDPGKVSGLQVELDGPPRQNFNTWEVSGVLRNQGKQRARLAKVELVALDERGQMLGVETAFPEETLIDPEKASRFHASLMLDERPDRIVPTALARPAP
jgi:hypothetical protein